MSDIDLEQQADQSIILEAAVKKRVREALVEVLTTNDTEIHHKIAKKFSGVVRELVDLEIKRQKERLITEICITVGKVIGSAQFEEDRRPLWESTPEEFGLTKESLNTHNMGNTTPEGIDHAIRKQT